MRLTAFRRIGLCLLLIFAGLLQLLQAQDTVRVMQYNLLRYGAGGIGGCVPTGVTTRNSWLTSIIQEAMPDIFGVNEIGPYSGPTSPANNLLINVLRPLNPDYQATQITYSPTQDIANMMYYNSAKVGLHSQTVIPEPFRNIDFYRFYHKNAGLALGDTVFIEVVLVHLSASAANTREAQTNAIMAYLNGLARPGNFIVIGDMNMSGASAQAFQNMVAYSNLDCRMFDPLSLNISWYNNNAAKHAWSQSTRTSTNTDCGSGGGLNDRFDMILTSNSIKNNLLRVQTVPGSYWVIGNPNAPNRQVPGLVLSNLSASSDHYPTVLDLAVTTTVGTARPFDQKLVQILGNPAIETIRLRLDHEALEGSNIGVSLLGVDGKLVRNWRLGRGTARGSVELPLDGIANGLYFLQIMADEGLISSNKILVARD